MIGIETALHFHGPAIDGPFQLYNSLRRISAGQRAGVDFQFFHGLGIPYLHYLPFRALGGTFVASEATRELMSVMVHPILILVFLRFFISDATRALKWSVIVMALSIALRMTSMLFAVNSLLGLRSTVPTLLPVLLCLHRRRAVRVGLTGIAIGCALVMGTEQGLAVALALIIATTAIAWRSQSRAVYIADTIAELAVGGATLVALLTMVAGVRGMHGALEYNFRLVPLDQYWYFGAPPNLFLSSWSAIPGLFSLIPRIAVTLALGATAVAFSLWRLWKGANGPLERRYFAFATLSLYGLISCTSLLGTFVNVYVQPEMRVLLLIGAVWIDGYLNDHDIRLGRRLVFGASRVVTSTALVALVIMIAVVPSMLGTIFVTMPHVLTDHVLHRVGAVYTGIWPQTLAEGQMVIDAHRNPDGSPPTIWSTYAGLLEARNGRFHPSFDYIIHALGPANRANYVGDFVRLRPQIVQTVLPTYTQF
ncbi:MAG TPA: hypothetical protein VII52_13000, partial [Gemmatimonadaceae bacterium]